MEIIYLVLVIVLFALAISDLVVGVSNDAVNFLNSAIGAKAAPFKIIMVIAAFGVLVGATFSSGMMEVARKGIFFPGMFSFSEIMFIFLAVMVTDIILLDTFNTFGLPTSTTVSIVFELLGAAVGIAVIKLSLGDGSESLNEFINSGKALAIIAGILLSVVVAFSAGALVQYLTRLLFSFRYEKRMRYYGSIWGGLAITAITYFILIKGAKGSSFMSEDVKEWIKLNTMLILAMSFAGWTIIIQVLRWIARINILKFIVLVGTFALAMAFAGNDLVNFIGVPLAGYESFKVYLASGATDPDSFSMTALAGKVSTPTYFLLIAGLIMVLTLWFSKKAKSVVKTTLDLSRQEEGTERFGSTMLSRSLVRSSINLTNVLKILIPVKVQNTIEKQFDQSPLKVSEKKPDAPSFDMIRASVNLMIASILISFATSLKLPLSTTYVTFMVAMGTSLADRAWGRESAVYRITGVVSVVGGWFFTAFSAFTVAFLLAMLFYFGGFIAVIGMVAIAVFLIVRTHSVFKKKETEAKEVDEEDIAVTEEINKESVYDSCLRKVNKSLKVVKNEYQNILTGLEKEDLQELKEAKKAIEKQSRKAKKYKDNIDKVITKLQEDSIDTGHHYVQVLDYIREMLHSISFMVAPVYEHINNTHKTLTPEQLKELYLINQKIINLIDIIQGIIESENYGDITTAQHVQQEILSATEIDIRNQIQRIKSETIGTKNSILYFKILTETKNIVLQAFNVLKAQRDFADFKSNGSNTIENNN